MTKDIDAIRRAIKAVPKILLGVTVILVELYLFAGAVYLTWTLTKLIPKF